MDIELQTKTNGNHGATCLSKEQVTAGNGDGAANSITDVGENDGLLSAQTSGCNGGTVASDHAVETQINLENIYTPQETSAVCRIKGELNKVIFWRVKLWMAIIFLFVLIFAVIIISMILCSVIHEDKDEIFDRSTFKVPQCFNGSFQLPNLVFTEELFTMSSNESQTLARDLKKKLADLYRSSPALGRYFFKADIYAFRNQSLMADYQLTFRMPADHQDQLRNVTLSRKMVYNVFRQFLYDQEPDESGQMYIDPVSLKMLVAYDSHKCV